MQGRAEHQHPRPRRTGGGTRRRGSLSREAIVAAAIRLADAEGLDAVSMRRVAEELDARTMSLYSHVENKGELLDLMFDAVNVTEPDAIAGGGWRRTLTDIARQTRATLLAHPWLITLIGRRAPIGPTTVRHLEYSLSAVASLGLDRPTTLLVLRVVDFYTAGHVTMEIAERERARELGLDRARWREITHDYLRKATENGDFPHLTAFGARGLSTETDPEQDFRDGLSVVLDGIAVTLRQHGAI